MFEMVWERSVAICEAVRAYLGYAGGRAELQGLLRLALSQVVDVRDPIKRARDRIAARAARAEV